MFLTKSSATTLACRFGSITARRHARTSSTEMTLLLIARARPHVPPNDSAHAPRRRFLISAAPVASNAGRGFAPAGGASRGHAGRFVHRAAEMVMPERPLATAMALVRTRVSGLNAIEFRLNFDWWDNTTRKMSIHRHFWHLSDQRFFCKNFWPCCNMADQRFF